MLGRALDFSVRIALAIEPHARCFERVQRRITMDTLDGKLILTFVVVVALLMLSGLIAV